MGGELSGVARYPLGYSARRTGDDYTGKACMRTGNVFMLADGQVEISSHITYYIARNFYPAR